MFVDYSTEVDYKILTHNSEPWDQKTNSGTPEYVAEVPVTQ
jgi:hypothetical protein